MDKLAWAKAYFGRDRFATDAAGIEIVEADDARAVCVMPITDKIKNADDQVMGGAIFTLADIAFAVSANAPDAPDTVTLSSEIHFLSAAKGETLIAEAKCIKRGKRVCVTDVTVLDDTERIVAKAVITGLSR